MGRPSKEQRRRTAQLALEVSMAWFELVREAGQTNLLDFAKWVYETKSPYLALVTLNPGRKRLRLKEWAEQLRIYKLKREGRTFSEIAPGKPWSTVKSAYEKARAAIPQESFESHTKRCTKYQQNGKLCPVCDRLLKSEVGERYERERTTGTIDLELHKPLQEYLAQRAEDGSS